MDMNIQTVLIIIALCSIILCISSCLLPVAVKKGWKVGGTLQTADKAVDIADIITKAVSPLLPATFATVTEKIIGYAKTAVAAAEQLYSIGNLQGEQRKQYAVSFITDALKLENCEVTPEVSKLIDSAVEASVSFMKNSDTGKEV